PREQTQFLPERNPRMAQSTGGSCCSRFCRPTDFGREPLLQSARQRHTTTGRSAVTRDGASNRNRCPDCESDRGEENKARHLAATSMRGYPTLNPLRCGRNASTISTCGPNRSKSRSCATC